jgi:serine/threonine-protein kinase
MERNSGGGSFTPGQPIARSWISAQRLFALVLVVGVAAAVVHLWPLILSYAWNWNLRIPGVEIPAPTLRIESDPPGAMIRIDGAEVGRTPLVMDNIYRPRSAEVILTLKDYHAWMGHFVGRRPALVQAKLIRR